MASYLCVSLHHSPTNRSPGSVLDKKVSGKIEDNLFTTLFYTAREYSRQTIVSPTVSLDSYLTAPDSPLYDGLSKEEREYATQMSRFLDGGQGLP
jgi:hypothetical protein